MFKHYNFVYTKHAPSCLLFTAPDAEKLNNLDSLCLSDILDLSKLKI